MTHACAHPRRQLRHQLLQNSQNTYFCYCSAFKYVLYKVNYAVHCMCTVVLSVRITSNVTCAVYTGLLRNKFHSSNRHDIHNLLRNFLATEKQREEALDVDDLICHNFPNFGPEPFCIGQIFLQPQKIAELVK